MKFAVPYNNSAIGYESHNLPHFCEGDVRIMSTMAPAVVHPGHEDFSTNIAEILSTTGSKRIVAQKLGFNTLLTDTVIFPEQLVQGQTASGEDVGGFFRSATVTDGLILPRGQGVLGLVMNADCPVGVLYNREVGAVLHLGLENLAKPEAEVFESLLFNAVKRLCTFHCATPETLQFQLSFGAGPESYGLDPNPEGKFYAKNQETLSWLKQFWPDAGTTRCTLAPRQGHLAVDLFEVAKGQARAAGLKEENVQICTVDTAAIGREDGLPWFWSNIHDRPVQGRPWQPRNGVIVQL